MISLRQPPISTDSVLELINAVPSSAQLINLPTGPWWFLSSTEAWRLRSGEKLSSKRRHCERLILVILSLLHHHQWENEIRNKLHECVYFQRTFPFCSVPFTLWICRYDTRWPEITFKTPDSISSPSRLLSLQQSNEALPTGKLMDQFIFRFSFLRKMFRTPWVRSTEGVLLCDVALAPSESVSNRAPNADLIALAEVFLFTQQTLSMEHRQRFRLSILFIN